MVAAFFGLSSVLAWPATALSPSASALSPYAVAATPTAVLSVPLATLSAPVELVWTYLMPLPSCRLVTVVLRLVT
ncbi:hypothetical protein NB688_000978 [Xanthomonas sacchari]|uniref:Secreted protein n=1 Tax=Xanthomonas sacchari TaxID=56458 RepID=A0ABT3E2L6_9XANT|nr:hypothetical protein [Xanthomonas sacchari]MCW0401804.1 hypothetical protein [Xanthomonas sacchari]MCW0418812.1 hypothetical protein [Xanthomonas sacchari]